MKGKKYTLNNLFKCWKEVLWKSNDKIINQIEKVNFVLK